MLRRKVLPYLSVCLVVLQLLLILVSWLVAAARPDWAVHSMLSSEGVRWFLSRFVWNLGSPLFVWIVLLGMAWGVFESSRLASALCHIRSLYYQERFALRLVWLEVFAFAVVLLLLTAVPHAILLSVTGSLWQGAFPQSIVPVIALLLMVTGGSYGFVSGTYHSVVDIFEDLVKGIAKIAPLLVVYILAAQLFHSVLFVFYLW